MGTSLTSIHIYADTTPERTGFSFRSFSPHWFTCVNDFSDQAPGYTDNIAKSLSKAINAPVLHFGVFDSEMIWFAFFRDGKCIARYSDDEFVANKKLYDIPSLVGYEEGNKKRLSAILSCPDVELKISMLEEFFGVCLLYAPDFCDEQEILCRHRGDSLYRAYQEEEKKLTGKSAAITVKLIREYPGKLFWHEFGQHGTIKPHFFLHGYTLESIFEKHYHTLTPMQFTGQELIASDYEQFSLDRIPENHKDSRFAMDYGTPTKVTFSASCPEEYQGKTMVLPNGYYPLEFLPTGELLLEGNHRIYVVDLAGKIIAKLSIQGDIADVVGNYILTTTGDSFCGYVYEPKAKIRIYEVMDHRNLSS